MVLRIGHRGACGYAEENTLASFEKAIELGVDMVELDVHLCKSGEVVVFHDFEIKGRKIHDMKLEELKVINEDIPLLEEVLDLFDKRVDVNVELKEKGCEERVCDLIGRYVKEKSWKKELFLVSSFDLGALRKFRKFDEDVRLGVLCSDDFDSYLSFAKEISAYSIHVPVDLVSKARVEKAHAEGLKIFVWTVNEPEVIERMKNMEVDGIFSDFPDRV